MTWEVGLHEFQGLQPQIVDKWKHQLHGAQHVHFDSQSQAPWTWLRHEAIFVKLLGYAQRMGELYGTFGSAGPVSQESQSIQILTHTRRKGSSWLVVWNMAFIFHNIWDNPSHWLIFFKMVKTTNQLGYVRIHSNCLKFAQGRGRSLPRDAKQSNVPWWQQRIFTGAYADTLQSQLFWFILRPLC